MNRAVSFLSLLIGICLVSCATSGNQGEPIIMKPQYKDEPVAFHFIQGVDLLTLETERYRLEIPKEGFSISVKRGDETILETASPEDPLNHFGFERGGQEQHLTSLTSTEESETGVSLVYETSYGGASALIDIRPLEKEIQITSRILHSEGDLSPALRFRLEPSGFWYGGGYQGWRDRLDLPLNNAHIRKTHFLAQSGTQGTPVWYATKGVGIWIDTPFDFQYTVNEPIEGNPNGLLSFRIPQTSVVTYRILVGDHIRDIVQHIISTIGYPRTTPPVEFFRMPIYTTWVEYKTDVNQEKVLAFARAITENNLPCGVIEIDDRWESRYGDMTFDPVKFPDPKAMVDELHRMGYRVTLWVHPFVNRDSKAYAAHRTDGLLLRDPSGEAGLIKWWNGIAAVWDFTHPLAAESFRKRLADLQHTYGFDGFKFDGGDVNLVPRDPRAHIDLEPAEYADVYNREATAHFEWNETRVGIYSQPLGIVQRLMDKHSVWGLENGLGAIIPEAIVVSMRGFPFLMPDMVGGNQYDGDAITKELLIRWAQASALMPFLQFSRGPWHFDEEAIRLTREASLLHIRFTPYIYRLADTSRTTGEPILRPLWYGSPSDDQIFSITDQYMVGSDIIVAPVLQQGASSRDLYLPAGTWRDIKSDQVTEGGKWIRNHPAPIDTVPVFVRVDSEADSLARSSDSLSH